MNVIYIVVKINRTASRTIQILAYVTEQKNGATTAEIAKHLNAPKTSIYDIVTALVQEEMLQVEWKESKHYKIGVRAFEIGSKFSTDLSTLAQKTLRELSNTLGQTTFLAVENRGAIIYLSKCEPKDPITTTASLGSRKPMYCTALGKVILASYSDKDVVEQIHEFPIKVHTKHTVKNTGELLKELQAIRKQGYAIDDREQEDFLKCVAAPIYNHCKQVVAAISTSFIYQGNEDMTGLSAHITQAALNISHQLGYPERHFYRGDLI